MTRSRSMSSTASAPDTARFASKLSAVDERHHAGGHGSGHGRIAQVRRRHVGDRRPRGELRAQIRLRLPRAASRRGSTAAARSPRRIAGARLERVVLERIHDAGARDLRDPRRGPMPSRVGDDHLPRRRGADERLEPDADQRGELAARDLRRPGESHGTPPAAARPARVRPRRRSSPSAPAVGSIAAAFRYAASAPAKSSALLEQLADLHRATPRRRVEFDGAAEVLERASRCPAARSSSAELAVEERAVGRRLERALRSRAGLIQPAGGRRGTRRLDDLLQVRKPKHVDPAATSVSDASAASAASNAAERVDVALQREQRLPPPTSAGTYRGAVAQRGVEPRQRAS